MIGKAVAQKSPFAKLRENRLQRRKLDHEWDNAWDETYQEFYLFPVGADLSDYFYTYPSMYVYSDAIDVISDIPKATYNMYIFNDEDWTSVENCYLESYLDPETFRPLGGFPLGVDHLA